MLFWRLIAFVGAAALIAGVFLPFLDVPWLRDRTFFEATPEAGWILLGISAISLVLIALKRLSWLYVTGIAALALTIYTVNTVQETRAEYLTDVRKALEGSPLKGVGESFINSVDLNHGLWILIAGSVILILVPLLSRRLELKQ